MHSNITAGLVGASLATPEIANQKSHRASQATPLHVPLARRSVGTAPHPAAVARASSPCDATQSRPLGFGILLFGIYLGFGILGFGIFPSTPASAAPYIEYLYPAGSQQGSTLEITMGGRALDGARAVWVSGEGVTGQVLEVNQPTEKQIREAQQLDAIASQTARIRLTIAPDAPPGVRDLRIMAKDGLSNRFRFEIGTLPEISEVEPNNNFAQAQLLPDLPLVVNGQITNADRDFFRFHARVGQRLLLEVKARSIKPYLADAVPGWFQARIALYDGDGKKIAEQGSFRFDPDPVMFFNVPADGYYTVEIWDALSRGRDDLVYRLKIGELPYVTDIFPLGGAAGADTQRVMARGINLPGPTTDTKCTVPTKQPGITQLTAQLPTGATNPRPFELSTLPEITEREPNDLPRQAQRVTLPVIINGRIDKPGDRDIYAFHADAGDKLVFDVMARRLGSPLDARIYLGPMTAFTSNNKKQVLPPTSDDEKDERFGLITAQVDPRLAYTFKKAGNYTITIEDVQGHGGPEYSYRLHISPAQPDYELRVMPDNLTVPAGGNVVMQLKAFRLDGYTGPIRLHTEGLPTGFNLGGTAEIPAGKDTAVLTLTAPLDAKPGVYTPRYWAEADIDGKTVRHDVSPAEELMQAFYYMHNVPVDQGYLIVNPKAAFRIELDRPADAGPLEIPLGKEIELPVRIIREPAYPAAVTSQGNAKNKQQQKIQQYKARQQAQQAANQPINVNITKGRDKGVVVTPASIQPGETTGVIKILCTNNAMVGQTGIFIVEAAQRARGSRVTAVAPALLFKVLPSEDGQPVKLINAKNTKTATASKAEKKEKKSAK